MLEEFNTTNTIVYDSKDEDALVQAMYTVDRCLLIPMTLKIRLPSDALG